MPDLASFTDAATAAMPAHDQAPSKGMLAGSALLALLGPGISGYSISKATGGSGREGIGAGYGAGIGGGIGGMGGGVLGALAGGLADHASSGHSGGLTTLGALGGAGLGTLAGSVLGGRLGAHVARKPTPPVRREDEEMLPPKQAGWLGDAAKQFPNLFAATHQPSAILNEIQALAGAGGRGLSRLGVAAGGAIKGLGTTVPVRPGPTNGMPFGWKATPIPSRDSFLRNLGKNIEHASANNVPALTKGVMGAGGLAAANVATGGRYNPFGASDVPKQASRNAVIQSVIKQASAKLSKEAALRNFVKRAGAAPVCRRIMHKIAIMKMIKAAKSK